MANENIYGIQRVDPVDVRTSGEILTGSIGMAAQGAKLGSNFGPIGTGIGAAAGLTAGIIAGNAGQRKEMLKKSQQDTYNDFVENLEGRSLRNQRVIAQQARHGMNAGRYMMAEIEGDGGYKYGQGRKGEIHTDQNFNLKSNAAGAPTHEEGGMKVMMEEGDVVFPTQHSEKKYKQIMGLINRYKINGDEKAKKQLEKIRDGLPSDDDYGYNKYPDGTSGFDWNTGIGSPSFIKDQEELFRKVTQTSAGEQEAEDSEQYIEYDEEGDPYVAKRPKKTGIGENYIDYDEEGDPYVATRYPDSPGTEAQRSHRIYTDKRLAEGEEATMPDLTQDYGTTDIEGGTPYISPLGTRYQPLPEDKPRFQMPDINIPEREGDPMKYASAITNAMYAAKPAETVTRRHVSFTPAEYKDLSETARNRAVEQRNFQTRARQNRVSRSGALGTDAQIGAQYNRQMDAINEREAARQYQTDLANRQMANQVAQANVQIARQDDDKDAANRAMKQRFASTSAAEWAELGQYGEQADYMRRKDAAAAARDADIIDRGLLGSKDFVWDREKGVTYVGDVNKTKETTTKKPKVNSTKYTIDPKTGVKTEKKVETFEQGTSGLKTEFKPGSYKMLPDGTIIIN